MQRVVATVGGVLVLAMVAGGLAEATMGLGDRGNITNDILLRPAKLVQKTVATATPKPAVASPTVKTVPTPSVAPTPTPTPTPAAPMATTNSFVHMRSGKSTSTSIVVDLNGGTVVQLLSDSDAQWQQVSYNGQTGYIFKTYLTY